MNVEQGVVYEFPPGLEPRTLGFRTQMLNH